MANISAKDGTGQDVLLSASGLGTIASPYTSDHRITDGSGNPVDLLTNQTFSQGVPSGLTVGPNGLNVSTGLNLANLATRPDVDAVTAALETGLASLEVTNTSGLSAVEIAVGSVSVATQSVENAVDALAVVTGAVSVSVDAGTVATGEVTAAVALVETAVDEVTTALGQPLTIDTAGLADTTGQASTVTAVNAITAQLAQPLDVSGQLTLDDTLPLNTREPRGLPQSGSATVVTAGTAVQLPAASVTGQVFLRVPDSNTGPVYVGGNAVGNNFSGFYLDETQPVLPLEVDNLSSIYIDADNDGDSITWVHT